MKGGVCMGPMYWLILLALLLLIEMVTLGLTTVWFAGGALIAFFVSILQGNLFIQLLAFFIVSFLLLFLTRPVAVKYFNKQRVKTNYQSIIGQEGKVTKRIDNFNNSGEVILNGQEWTARAADDTAIFEVNERVVVKEIAGVKLIVGKKEEEV